MKAEPISSSAATPTAAHEHSANSKSAHHYALHKRARRQSNENSSATVRKVGEKKLAMSLSRPSSRPRRRRRFRKHRASNQLTLTRKRGVPSRLTRRKTRRLFRCFLRHNRIGWCLSRHQFPIRHRPRLSQRPPRARLKFEWLRVTARRSQRTRQRLVNRRASCSLSVEYSPDASNSATVSVPWQLTRSRARSSPTLSARTL